MSEKNDLFTNWVKAFDAKINHQDIVLNAHEQVALQEGKIIIYKIFNWSKIKGKPCVVCRLFSKKECEHFDKDKPCTDTTCPTNPDNIKWFEAKKYLSEVQEEQRNLDIACKQARKSYTK